MYKNIIVDLYAVLIDVKEEKTDWEKMAHFMGYQGAVYTGEELKEAFGKVKDKYLSRYNSKNDEVVEIQDILLKLYSNKKVKIKPKVLKQTALVYRMLSTGEVGLYDEALQTLKALKDGKRNVYALANGQRVDIVGELNVLELTPYFRDIMASSDFHQVMTDPAAMKKLMGDNGMKKSETIYVGKCLKKDAKIAKDAGIDSLCVCTEEDRVKAGTDRATYHVDPGNRKKITKILLSGKA